MSLARSRGDATSPVRRPRRVRYPDLSPPAPPAIDAVVAFWPAWTKLPVEQINYDAFDDEGRWVCQQGRAE